MATLDLNDKGNYNVVNKQHGHHQVHHQQIIIENPRNIDVSRDLSYCETHQKNKPQSNSVAGVIFLLIVSGMHIGWGIWRIQIFEPWAFVTPAGIIMFVLMSWHVFAVVGSVVGAVLVTKMRKKFIYYIGGALLIVSNVMFIAWYTEHQAIIVGRCLAGLTHGIIYNAAITHAAENVVKDIRGMLLSSTNSIMFSGVFVESVLSYSIHFDDYYTMSSDAIFGIFGLILSVLGIICTFFLTYESVPYLLRRDNETEAIVNLLKLRNESVMTPKLTNELDEMKLMVGQDKQQDQNILSNGNGSVVLKMIALRLLSTMTNNFLVNYILISLATLLLNPYSYYMAPLVLCGARFAASFIPIFSTDFIRRKIHLTVSSVTSGVIILILGIIFAAVNNWSTSSSRILGVLCILFQIFVSLGIDPMQHLLLSEAFSTSKKAWSIALVTSIEYLLQILFIGVFFINPISIGILNVVFFVTAGVMLILAFVLQFAITETHKTSMKEARDLFCKPPTFQ